MRNTCYVASGPHTPATCALRLKKLSQSSCCKTPDVGAFLEGAGWDFENGCLVEPEPMELIVPMPIIHFKPVENKKKVPKGVYLCPMYLYPVRTGSRERPSFVINVELKSGSNGSEHWVKRGTAVLLSLAT